MEVVMDLEVAADSEAVAQTTVHAVKCAFHLCHVLADAHHLAVS